MCVCLPRIPPSPLLWIYSLILCVSFIALYSFTNHDSVDGPLKHPVAWFFCSVLTWLYIKWLDYTAFGMSQDQWRLNNTVNISAYVVSPNTAKAMVVIWKEAVFHRSRRTIYHASNCQWCFEFSVCIIIVTPVILVSFKSSVHNLSLVAVVWRNWWTPIFCLCFQWTGDGRNPWPQSHESY